MLREAVRKIEKRKVAVAGGGKVCAALRNAAVVCPAVCGLWFVVCGLCAVHVRGLELELGANGITVYPPNAVYTGVRWCVDGGWTSNGELDVQCVAWMARSLLTNTQARSTCNNHRGRKGSCLSQSGCPLLWTLAISRVQCLERGMYEVVGYIPGTLPLGLFRLPGRYYPSQAYDLEAVGQ
ncbi:hypothetical protein B0T17DRAFT_509559 [Bombardia bombarda]|uniref:Uncharacterized protein n=1 Tax=Bombardia bombarda TaxID=252184 RepID=A0AA40BY12_9PEZI|nr:hypothetical protein B0T17DRAFT_509559 [Bombardia bombarda]